MMQAWRTIWTNYAKLQVREHRNISGRELQVPQGRCLWWVIDIDPVIPCSGPIWSTKFDQASALISGSMCPIPRIHPSA